MLRIAIWFGVFLLIFLPQKVDACGSLDASITSQLIESGVILSLAGLAFFFLYLAFKFVFEFLVKLGFLVKSKTLVVFAYILSGLITGWGLLILWIRMATATCF